MREPDDQGGKSSKFLSLGNGLADFRDRAATHGLMVNADDWGLNHATTDRTLDCVRYGTVSAVSAMVFMEDSERAAEIARNEGMDSGLHLNFTAPFTASGVPARVVDHQNRLSGYLLRNRLAQVVFHPGLSNSFEYVVSAQISEFAKLYGSEPERIDGHHHMHLCANVLWGGLLPSGTRVRKSFSFEPGEKSIANRWYRKGVDRILGRHHVLTDYFFSIQPLSSLSRLKKIVDLSRQFKVEMETHPQTEAEHAFLMSKEFRELIGASALNVSDGIGSNRMTQV